MATTTTLVSVEDYLRTSYHPDCGRLEIPATPAPLDLPTLFASLQ